MLQVLIIDDEPLVHRDLSTLTAWNESGCELCGEAYSGAMALEMIERFPPHIAIIDVNMPGMNGVELNRTIRGRFPAIQTIMLSSYDDYDYVRECLNDGAIDYLLKHRLDEASLLAVLDKALLAIRQEDRNAVHRADDEASAGRMNAAEIREHIADLARGKPEAANDLSRYASRENGLYHGAVRYAAAIVQITPFLLLTETYSDRQTNKLMQQAVEMIQQSLGEVQERTVAYVEEGRLAIVFSFKDRSEHAAASEASRQMIKLRHSLEMFLNLKSIYAVGHICGSLTQLVSSFDAAVRDLDRIGVGSAGAPDGHESLTIEEQKKLLLAIERLDRDAVVRLIAEVFVKLHNLPIHSQSVQKVVSELLQIGDKAWKKSPAALATTVTDRLPSRTDLGRIEQLGELEKWINIYYASLLQQLKQQRVSGTHSRHVSQAIQLILEHYRNGITLEQAAGEIGLHPSYLSRIFKEEVQATFSEYLNKVRIAAACKLLESGQYSIKEISGQVGFATHNYFFKVFKELNGITPHAYVTSLTQGSSTVKYVE